MPTEWLKYGDIIVIYGILQEFFLLFANIFVNVDQKM